MIKAQVSGIATPNRITSPVYRVSSRGFWILFAIEGVLMTAVLIVVLHFLLPARAPLAQSTDYAAVREAIWSRLNGTINDPLVEITPGITARSSAIRGFSLNGQVYYYYLEGQRGFDPLSRGAVSTRSIEIVLRDDDGPKPLIIYRLLNQ
jgi:hypothetical protein